MTRQRQPRQSAEQWSQLITQQQISGLPIAQFCREHDIAYASFCQWRRRLAANISKPLVQEAPQEPAFIDLEHLLPGNARPWNIVLRLGNGIELCLSQ